VKRQLEAGDYEAAEAALDDLEAALRAGGTVHRRAHGRARSRSHRTLLAAGRLEEGAVIFAGPGANILFTIVLSRSSS
jgi:hypothetical protein